jgi:tubulin alpha
MGKYMACTVTFRGDIIPRDTNRCVNEIKRDKNIQFISWCPGPFRVRIDYQPNVVIPGGDLAAVSRSCCMISNSTSISTVFSRIEHKFDLMYAKRAFVHWYAGEGM